MALGTQDMSEQARAEAEVRHFQEALGPFVIAAEKTRMPMAFTDATSPDDLIVFANDSLLALTGFERAELIGRSLTSMIVKGADRAALESEAHQCKRGEASETDMIFRRKDGSDFCAEMLKCAVADEAGVVVQNFFSLVDLTKYRKTEAALRISEHRFRMAATVTGLGIADIDLLNHEEHWSMELRNLLGVPEGTPASSAVYSALIHPDDRMIVMSVHGRALAGLEDQNSDAVFRIIRPSDGEHRWIESERHVEFDDAGAVTRVIVTNRDITTEKTAQDSIAWAATHDSVTGLLNRSSFRVKVETALAVASAQGEVCSLLLIDVDQFKSINDLLGHQAGDEALWAFAARIVEAMPRDALLARLGGDEFAAVLPGTDKATATVVGERILAHLKPSFLAGIRTIDLRASIGIGSFPMDGRGYSALACNADLALYAAKEAGGATVRTFTPVLAVRGQQELAKLRHARLALVKGWIEPFYQPKIALASGRIAGFEALLRWRHPRAGLQLPDTIANAFDDSHLAAMLGVVMAEAVLTDMGMWKSQETSFGKIAINVSAAEFRNPDYASDLLALVDRHGITPTDIEVEITETAFLKERAGNVINMLTTLRAAGMTVALDDFGTGFSSLSHLRNFPVDTIKIDSSFVGGLENSRRDRDIIKAVLQLGNALGMTTVAEGIENEAQADFLATHDCVLGQGFYFAPAVAAGEVVHWAEKFEPG